MVIGVDARPLVEKKTGIGYFLNNTLTELLKIDTDNQYILFSDRNVFFDCSPYKNVSIMIFSDGRILKKSFFFFHKFYQVLKKQKIVLDWFWATNHVVPSKLDHVCSRILMNVHDFTHIFFPKTTTMFNRIVLGLYFKRSLRMADEIVCVSESTAMDLRRLFFSQIGNSKICVIHLSGIVEERTIGTEASDDVMALENIRYVLFIGTIEPRKDIGVLIDLAEKSVGQFKVVICGKIGWERKDLIGRMLNEKNIVYLDYVSDTEKTFLLRHCFCQIQPALYEGFGIPIVESIQNGAISIVADNSSQKEIIQNPILQFKTGDSDDLYRKIMALLSDEQLLKQAEEYCKKRADDFSWRKTAIRYHEIFEGINTYESKR